MLVSLIRFTRGYVDFKASGKFPERFLNITSRYGVNLWNANPVEGGLEASMNVSDYRRIRTIARKSKVKLRIVEKHGLPFIVSRYRIRLGLPAGAFAGLILILVLSNFIWSISITGTRSISNTYLRQVLSDNGVSIGAYKNNLDVEEIERDTILNVGEIGWMSINITGNVVSVEVKEKAEKPEISENKSPCNIKAKSDGVITKINVRSGTTQVLKGSGVAKGDLLVSGITETKLETIEYMHASGEIYADVIANKELKLPKTYNYNSISENKINKNQITFLWLEFPCSLAFERYDNYVQSFRTDNLYINNTVLPIGIRTQTDYEMKTESISPDKSSAEKIFENEALLYEAFEKSDSTVVSRKINIRESDKVFLCDIDYTFNENIAEEVAFSVTE